MRAGKVRLLTLCLALGASIAFATPIGHMGVVPAPMPDPTPFVVPEPTQPRQVPVLPNGVTLLQIWNWSQS